MLCIAIISVLKAIAWLYILFFNRREQVSIDLEKYKKEKEQEEVERRNFRPARDRLYITADQCAFLIFHVFQ